MLDPGVQQIHVNLKRGIPCYCIVSSISISIFLYFYISFVNAFHHIVWVRFLVIYTRDTKRGILEIHLAARIVTC